MKTLEKENMEAVRELATTNMAISEAKNVLFQLQDTETEYLVAREEKAVARIDKVLEDSGELVAKIRSNNEEVHSFCVEVRNYASFVIEAHEKLQTVLDTFKDRSVLWEAHMASQDKIICDTRKQVEEDRKEVELMRDDVAGREIKIAEDLALIESRQAALATSIETLRRMQ